METYLLQDLVRVREFREDRAGKAVIRARSLVDAARLDLGKKEKELSAYQKWRVEEEDRLLQSILLKKVKLGEITDLRLDIAALRERELEHIDAVKRAEGDLDKALEELERTRLAHIRATQELEKLVEHREAWKDEMRLEGERVEDLEMEEFSPVAVANFID
jgi:hypothetical protein